MERAQNDRAQFWPSGGAIHFRDGRAQGLKSNGVTAAVVAENVPPAADAKNGAGSRVSAKATGAGAAEDQHAGDGVRVTWRGRGGQGGFEVTAGVNGYAGPDPGGGGADALAILPGTCSGHADDDGVGRGRHRQLDVPEMFDETAVVEKTEIGRAELGALANSVRVRSKQGDGVGAAAFDAQVITRLRCHAGILQRRSWRKLSNRGADGGGGRGLAPSLAIHAQKFAGERQILKDGLVNASGLPGKVRVECADDDAGMIGPLTVQANKMAYSLPRLLLV